MMREAVTQEAAQAALRAYREFDVTALLPQVRSPTLVLHRRELRWLDVAIARGLASGISDARLALLQETGGLPYLGDMGAVLRTIDEFLGLEIDEVAERVPVRSRDAGGLVTILFTDMESSAALRQRLGDARAQELVRTHNSIVREALTVHGGREIKHTGDGIMSSFSTASSALECAIAIQRGIAAHVQEHPEAPLGVYIGLNAGEPIAEDKDLFGTSVDLARRICDHAESGQILVSDVVRQLAAGKSFLFADCGDTEMRGFEDPVKLWEVRWKEDV
jgi:class 3 adenylate cyclase